MSRLISFDSQDRKKAARAASQSTHKSRIKPRNLPYYHPRQLV
jgi:hypothetical protein